MLGLSAGSVLSAQGPLFGAALAMIGTHHHIAGRYLAAYASEMADDAKTGCNVRMFRCGHSAGGRGRWPARLQSESAQLIQAIQSQQPFSYAVDSYVSI